jgi:outer membrane protein assembly factor BamB
MPVVLVIAFWSVYAVSRNFIDTTITANFFTSAISTGLFVLLFSIWWLSRRAIPLAARLSGLGALVAVIYVVGKTSHESIGLFTALFYGVPAALTIWTVWLLVGGRRSAFVRHWGPAIAMAVVGIGLETARMDQLWGDLHAEMTWRWAPSKAELYKPVAATTTRLLPSSLAANPGDWPGLRGVDRNGEVPGVRISADWSKSPPKQIWHIDIGPGWSSMAIVGDRLFTQEQRDEQHEAVVCFEAATGQPLWVHQDEARHYESQGGAGPRGTPTFADGRIYSLGATGILNCLDAASGNVKWTHKIAADAGASKPMWGFSASPLVVGDRVIVYAGGGNKGLLAYRAESGEIAWTAPTGTQGYSSPQLVTIDGEPQVVTFDDNGLVAVDPATGSVRWQFEAKDRGWRTTQPRLVGKSEILFGSEDLGLLLADIKHDGPTWSAAKKWSSAKMHPAYNDFVLLEDSIYGFDEAIFCCMDVKTGERRWKAGRYGHGQAVLMPDDRKILVLTETGEVVLIAADPEKLTELGRFQAVEGKTWNHPVIAHGRLYVRNDHEMACYDLTETAIANQ